MLDIQKREFNGVYPDELAFVTDDLDEYPETAQRIVVHPWDRIQRDGRRDREVFLAVGNLTEDGQDNIDLEDRVYANIIVNREAFVEGLLAVFPELTKKED